MRRTIWMIVNVTVHLLGILYASISNGQEVAPLPPKPQVLPDSSGRIQPSRAAPIPGTLVTKPSEDVLPAPTLKSGFGVPEGLETPSDRLFSALGLGPSHCFPLTPTTCYEVGYKCYCRSMYRDALAFVNHGLKLSNHSRLYLLKSVCLMHLGDCDEAESTIRKYRYTLAYSQESIGLREALERVNDPMRVRMEYLLNTLD